MNNPTFMKTYIDGLNIPVENTIDIFGIIYFSSIILIFVLFLIYYSYFNFNNYISTKQ